MADNVKNSIGRLVERACKHGRRERSLAETRRVQRTNRTKDRNARCRGINEGIKSKES